MRSVLKRLLCLFLLCIPTDFCAAASYDYFTYKNEKQVEVGFGYIKHFDTNAAQIKTTKYFIAVGSGASKLEMIGKINSDPSGHLISVVQTSYVNKKESSKYEATFENKQFTLKRKTTEITKLTDPTDPAFIIASIVGPTITSFPKTTKFFFEFIPKLQNGEVSDEKKPDGSRVVTVTTSSGMKQTWDYLADGSLKSITVKNAEETIVATRLDQTKQKMPVNPLKDFFEKND